MENKSINKPNDFDFAFSFAGEDRELVEAIKSYLTEKNYKVFYDNDFQAKLLGKDLYTYLRKIYQEKGKYVVCFISDYYRKKVWTTLEFTAIKERLMSTFFASDFLIPVIIGNAEIFDDIPSFIGFSKYKSTIETAELLIQKYNNNLIEDNYIKNIGNCIDYICEQIAFSLSDDGINADRNNQNEIIIDCNGIKFYYEFIHDEIAQIPCILLYKNDRTGGASLLKVPSLFINWNRENIINFSIHCFENYDHNLLVNLTLHDLIYNIEKYIIKDIHGGK